jgi:hypothetical protein
MPKKKNNIVIKILLILFIIYMGLYIANISGYYESKIRDRTVVTDEKIKEFENKVSLGEEIDIDSFLDNERVDYSSKMSNLGDNITNNFENIIARVSKVFKNIVKSLF